MKIISRGHIATINYVLMLLKLPTTNAWMGNIIIEACFCVPRIYLTEYTDCVLIVIWGFIMHKSKCTCVWTKARLECIYIFPIKIYNFYEQRYHNIHVLRFLHLHWDQPSAFHLKSFHYSLFVLFRSLKWGSIVYVNFRWKYFEQILRENTVKSQSRVCPIYKTK